MLVRSVISNSSGLVEYNDLGIRIKTLKGTKEISFEKISSFEIRSHGNLAAVRLIVKTFSEN